MTMTINNLGRIISSAKAAGELSNDRLTEIEREVTVAVQQEGGVLPQAAGIELLKLRAAVSGNNLNTARFEASPAVKASLDRFLTGLGLLAATPAAQPNEVDATVQAKFTRLHEAILSSVPEADRADFAVVVRPLLNQLNRVAGALANAAERPSAEAMSPLLASLDMQLGDLPVLDAAHDAKRQVADAAEAVLGTRDLSAGVRALVANVTAQ